jgi:predicted GIY-YIG superfamily endonuclease
MPVYLIHLDRPLCHSEHYLGYADDLDARLERHASGQGARMLAVCRKRGITWRLARTWEGGRAIERRLKRRHEAPLLCPVCSGDAAFGKASLKPKPVKITMSQRDQMAVCLSCPLSDCVGNQSPRCPMQDEQKQRHRAKHERQKARGWVEKRRARRAAARQARAAAYEKVGERQ